MVCALGGLRRLFGIEAEVGFSVCVVVSLSCNVLFHFVSWILASCCDELCVLDASMFRFRIVGSVPTESPQVQLVELRSTFEVFANPHGFHRGDEGLHQRECRGRSHLYLV